MSVRFRVLKLVKQLMELYAKNFLFLFIVPRLIGPRLEYAKPISMTENRKRTHFAEIAKRLKNELQGNDKKSQSYLHSLFQC